MTALKVKIFADGAEKASMMGLYRRPQFKGAIGDQWENLERLCGRRLLHCSMAS